MGLRLKKKRGEGARRKRNKRRMGLYYFCRERKKERNRLHVFVVGSQANGTKNLFASVYCMILHNIEKSVNFEKSMKMLAS